MESVKSTKKPLGRPAIGESREKLTTVVFKADAATRAALDRLVARAQAEGHKRARSAVIRAAILAADVTDSHGRRPTLSAPVGARRRMSRSRIPKKV